MKTTVPSYSPLETKAESHAVIWVKLWLGKFATRFLNLLTFG